MSRTGETRNLSIDGWRGVMALLVAAHHMERLYLGTRYFFTGYLAVEFFFILSGFFLIKHLNEIPPDRISAASTPAAIVWSKIRRFFGLNLLCFLLMCIADFSGWGKGVRALPAFLKYAAAHLWDVFFLQNAGLRVAERLNGPAWYLSALLIGSYFIAVLYCWNRKLFLALAAPALILCNYAYLSHAAGSLFVSGGTSDGNNEVFFGFLNSGVVRGITGLCVGCLLYLFYDAASRNKVMKNPLPHRQKTLAVLLDLAVIAALLKLLIARHPSQNDFLVIPCLCAVILFSALRVGFSFRLMSAKPMVFLGNISLDLYLSHLFILLMVSRYLLTIPAVSTLPYWPKMLLFLFCAVLFAVFLHYAVMPFLRKIAVRFKNYINPAAARSKKAAVASK